MPRRRAIGPSSPASGDGVAADLFAGRHDSRLPTANPTNAKLFMEDGGGS
jgi:hypothetical protein